jgi:hypothetical protein
VVSEIVAEARRSRSARAERRARPWWGWSVAMESRRGRGTLARPGEEEGVGEGACWPGGGAGCHLRGRYAPYLLSYEVDETALVPSVALSGALLVDVTGPAPPVLWHTTNCRLVSSLLRFKFQTYFF